MNDLHISDRLDEINTCLRNCVMIRAQIVRGNPTEGLLRQLVLQTSLMDETATKLLEAVQDRAKELARKSAQKDKSIIDGESKVVSDLESKKD